MTEMLSCEELFPHSGRVQIVNCLAGFLFFRSRSNFRAARMRKKLFVAFARHTYRHTGSTPPAPPLSE